MNELKQYKWQIIGAYQVAPDLSLTNAVFICSKVIYDVQSRIAEVELCFVEGLDGTFKNYRSIFLQLAEGSESLDTATIVLFITSAYPTAIQLEPQTP